jgi:hypothetical protein
VIRVGVYQRFTVYFNKFDRDCQGAAMAYNPLFSQEIYYLDNRH